MVHKSGRITNHTRIKENRTCKLFSENEEAANWIVYHVPKAQLGPLAECGEASCWFSMNWLYSKTYIKCPLWISEKGFNAKKSIFR